MKHFLSLCLLLSFFLYGCGKKEEPTQPEEVWKPVPVDKVVVYKSQRLMHLMKKGKVIRTYSITMGENPVGHKMQEGDERTPEGKYILDWRNSKSSCYKSIHISYPNKRDKESAKKRKVSPGGSIMIHGLHPSINYLGKYHINWNWTDGCIAVTNEEMDEIWKSVKNGTSIEIFK